MIITQQPPRTAGSANVVSHTVWKPSQWLIVVTYPAGHLGIRDLLHGPEPQRERPIPRLWGQGPEAIRSTSTCPVSDIVRPAPLRRATWPRAAGCTDCSSARTPWRGRARLSHGRHLTVAAAMNRRRPGRRARRIGDRDHRGRKYQAASVLAGPAAPRWQLRPRSCPRYGTVRAG